MKWSVYALLDGIYHLDLDAQMQSLHIASTYFFKYITTLMLWWKHECTKYAAQYLLLVYLVKYIHCIGQPN